MIRLAVTDDLNIHADTEAAVRILSAYEAYGMQERFLQFYADDEGTRLMLMDGVAALHAPCGVNEEWISFLSMHPTVHTIRTDAATGAQLSKCWPSCGIKTGDYMTYNGEVPTGSFPCIVPRYEQLYAFLVDYFSLPPFDLWYVDVSHRVRHGYCHIASIIQDGEIVCNAMSVAQTTKDMLLGAVATAPRWRRRGLAAQCIRALIACEPTKRVHISPVDERARLVYERLGFIVNGTWAEIQRSLVKE